MRRRINPELQPLLVVFAIGAAVWLGVLWWVGA